MFENMFPLGNAFSKAVQHGDQMIKKAFMRCQR